MKKVIFLLIFLLAIVIKPYAQQEADPKITFLEAESFFLFEEYKEALPSYLKLLKLYPNNDNLNYRIGICYLNNPFEKGKSIDYLEKAVKNITRDYKENNFKETKAPQDAYFYLGNAYRVNNQLDKAIKNYNKFKEILDPKVYDIELVDAQITTCKNAQKLEQDPEDLDLTNLGDVINSRFSDIDPVVSGDEKSLVYVQQQQFYDAVFYSLKADGVWQPPRNIMAELGYDNDIYPTSLSYDGTELYLYSTDNFLGTLLVSKLVNGTWSKPERLNENINTKYWESHACISADGKTLYFTSNRKESGFGGLDIYKSTRLAKGDWGPAVNLGSTINTKYNEETPFITEDGKTLYFSSYGHFNIGGYDVFYSTLLDDGSWSVPVNAGYPINTPDDDMFFVPVKNGTYAYFPRYFENKTLGRLDIYRYEIYSSLHPRKFTIKGIVALKGAAGGPDIKTRISIYDRLKKDTVDLVMLQPGKEDFSLKLPAGEYDVIYNTNGYKDQTQKLVIPKNYKEGSALLSAELSPVEKGVKVIQPPREIIPSMTIKDEFITARVNEKVLIPILFDKAGKLSVQASVNGAKTKSELLDINKRKLIYEYAPQLGKNVLDFSFTDVGKDKTNRTVVIDCLPEIPTKDTAQLVPPVDSTPGAVIDLSNALKLMAKGNLRQTLDSLDLGLNHFKTSDELYNYLLDNAGKDGYTRQDVLDLMAQKSSKLTLDELIRLLASYADGGLKNVLADPFLPREKMQSGADLIHYLMSKAGEFKYKEDDVIALLVGAASRDCKDTRDFFDKLKLASTGNLASFLANTNLDKLKLKNNLDLINYVISQAAENNYTEEDVINTLLKMMGQNTVNEYLKKLGAAATGNLKIFLEGIDTEKLGIHSIADLIKYLLDQAKSNGYSEQDVYDLLLKLAGDKGPAIFEQNALSIYPDKQKGWFGSHLPVTIGILGMGILALLLIVLGLRKKSRS
jgi:tetratricopeptide (TPR) repeat protein